MGLLIGCMGVPVYFIEVLIGGFVIVILKVKKKRNMKKDDLILS